MSLSLLPTEPRRQNEGEYETGQGKGSGRGLGSTPGDTPQVLEPLFPLGQTVMTIEFDTWLKENPVVDPTHFILAHVLGMWDKLDPFDRRANELAIKNGDRIVSTYPAFGEEVLIITEADRSYTVLNLLRYY